MSIAKEVVVRFSQPEANVQSLDGSDLGVKVKFAEGGKPEYPDKSPRSQIEIDKSQSMGHRGGRHE